MFWWKGFFFRQGESAWKKFSVFVGGNTMIFRNSQYRETFIVFERDFLEVVEAMKKVYGISTE